MRFDDSLKTVLSAETTTEIGAQAAWRQLVDLIGRRRVPADEPAIERLRNLRDLVAPQVRAASARALASAAPPAALVALFGEDRPDIAAPVLRTATLDGDVWASVLPRLSPAGRSVLRHRRDLPGETVRALQAFGTTDFVLEHADPTAPNAPALSDVEEQPSSRADLNTAPPPLEASGDNDATATAPRFEIADLVARIDAYNRKRDRAPPASATDSLPVSEPATSAEAFRFETDAVGIVRWVKGVARTPLVGLDLSHMAVQGQAQVDGVVAGAYRRRSPFRDARLIIGGTSEAAGGWRLSGIPAFDPASGRVLGYRGHARRPRAEESAAPRRDRATSESLRQLVHELRTPTNAIAGFAELIETELFGPVAPAYREHAAVIRRQTGALIQAIDDLDTAARIEGGALELRSTNVVLHPLVARALADLRPLVDLRGAQVLLQETGAEAIVVADERAVERLVNRLLAALVSVAQEGERLSITVEVEGEAIALAVDTPAALGAEDDIGEADGAPLLGTAFALRLAGNLAVELSGALVIGAERLTLRLPAAVDRDMGQASTN